MTSISRRRCLLIVGCGDIGMRVLQLLKNRWQVLVLTSTSARRSELRAAGAVPLVGNLDDPASLGRLAGLADAVLHLAPPPGVGVSDPRTINLLRALSRSGRPLRFVYASTTGVYGDCGGELIDETRGVAPATDRARRRVAAEQSIRRAGRHGGIRATILRIPGIYALDRPGGNPRDRLLRATPVLRREDDVHTNHIHADDLARACVAALHRGRPQRLVNVCDRSELLMGDYFELAADLAGLNRPPRLTRVQAARVLSPLQLSFMTESRRMMNRRLESELKLVLRYPTVAEGLSGLAAPLAIGRSGSAGDR
jgi:nucleoside-diphosphate-sugar epimerase